MKKAALYRRQVDDFLEVHFAKVAEQIPSAGRKLHASMRYSTFNGGKRFRPMVTYLMAEAHGCSLERVTPLAAAVELIHTYSLIHDDLPVMDNDNWRRGQPTNHIAFDEVTALLAGDALLTEAFYILGDYYKETPEVGLELVKLLSSAAGAKGMVLGQVLDMALQAGEIDSNDEVLKLHELKTGALIRIASEGVAVVARADQKRREASIKFGAALGLAFQLADDLLDFDPKSPDDFGFPKLFGVEKTKSLLKESTQGAIRALEVFGDSAHGARELIEFNMSRQS